MLRGIKDGKGIKFFQGICQFFKVLTYFLVTPSTLLSRTDMVMVLCVLLWSGGTTLQWCVAPDGARVQSKSDHAFGRANGVQSLLRHHKDQHSRGWCGAVRCGVVLRSWRCRLLVYVHCVHVCEMSVVAAVGRGPKSRRDKRGRYWGRCRWQHGLRQHYKNGCDPVCAARQFREGSGLVLAKRNVVIYITRVSTPLFFVRSTVSFITI